MTVSIEAIAWVLNDAPCDNPTQRLVLVALANHARPDGSAAFPSVATIRRYTALSERAIRYHLDELEQAGLIERCDARIVAAYIPRSDRRPVGFNLMLGLSRGVQVEQVVEERGANDDTNGVHVVQERGACHSERGAGDAPKPYITVQEPSIETVSQLNPEVPRLCNLLADLMVENGCRRPQVTKGWLDDMDRLIRLDGRSEVEVEGCIRWCQAHDFWRANILSPKKLRIKFDQLKLQAERERNSARPRGYQGIIDFVNET